ncbi:MAG: DUF4282 domain-containing protein [Cocleimonas sp.]|nr:DUF4282 domain-containing protein [Cocleimonas sp.]
MDFLSFKSFISIPVLIGFYYMGAVVMPIFLWFVSLWLTNKFQFIDTLQKKSKEMIWHRFTLQQKILFVVLFTMAFLFIELFWRMMFEFLIAYMQIRDALVH